MNEAVARRNTEDLGEAAFCWQILQNCENPFIVELGACSGDDTVWLCTLGKGQVTMLSVEADPQNFAGLAKTYADYQVRGTPVHMAICDHTGYAEFYRSEKPGFAGFSSLYPPVDGTCGVEPHYFKRLAEPVPCCTLDELYAAHNVEHVDLLWTDIHGAEKHMIQCGRNALARTRYLMMEFFYSPVYQGMATKNDLLGLLPDWRVVHEFPWNILLERLA